MPVRQRTRSRALAPASRRPSEVAAPSAAPAEVTKQRPSKLDVVLLSCGIVAPQGCAKTGRCRFRPQPQAGN